MRKALFFTVLLIIAVVFVAVLYFSNLSTDIRRNDQALSYIPADGALVAGFRYDDSFQEIFKDYKLFNALIGEDKALEINRVYDLLLNQPSLNEAAHNQNIFLSFHPNTSSIDLLWIITINNKINTDKIINDIKASNDITLKQIPSGVYEITLKTINKKFYLNLTDEVALGSFSKTIIEECLNPNTIKISNRFIAEINTNSQKNINSPFNLFINHKEFSSFARSFLNGESKGNTTLLKGLNGYSTLNMNFKSDALMFNGLSTTDSSNNNYLNIYLRQKPVNNTIQKSFPTNTANFIAFGISDNKSFDSDLKSLLKKRGELVQIERQLQIIKTETGVNFEKDIKTQWGKEFASLELANNEKLAVVQLLNGRKLGFFLEPLSSPYSENIQRFNNSNLLYYYFGDPLKPFSRPFYSIIDNYLVVANTASAVQQFLSSYTSEKLLSKDPAFLEFAQLLANQSNVFYFIHNKNTERILKNNLKEPYVETFKSDRYGLRDFYGLSFQWSSDGDHFLANLYANYIPSKSERHEILWQYKLNGAISMAPQIVSNSAGSTLVLVQDRINNLYALSADGKKLWSAQLEGKILGSIKQLYDHSLLFNTNQRLYRIDINGNNYQGFPVILPLPATYSATMTNTDLQNIKIFIPCNNRILGYDISGKTLEGWNKTVEGKILFDLKTANVDNTRYVIAGTREGMFYFFNQNGDLIGKVEDTAKKTFKNPLILEVKNDLKNSRIITTDTTGTLRSISFDGNISRKNIGIWTPDHFFEYKNISGDLTSELIYLDRNQLYVYDYSNSLVYNYEFPYAISNPPQFFQQNRFSYQIGVSSTKDDLLYLFNADGTLANGFPFKGKPNFYVGNIKNDGKKYLICGGKSNYLYVYKL